MANKKPKPFLLSVCLYSLLVIQLLLFVFLFLVIFKFDQLAQLRDAFGSKTNIIPITWWVYIPVSISLLNGYSVIQMLRQKIHAVLIFHTLSVLLILYLVLNPPYEWANIIFVVFINYLIGMHYSWFKKETLPLEESEDSSEKQLLES